MMAVEVRLQSRDDAQTVTEDLYTVWRRQDTRYCEVEYYKVLDDTSQESPRGTIFVRPVEAITIADGTELVQCVTQEGRQVSIFLPEPSQRLSQKAKVVLEPLNV